jgi:hypothetical protein
VWAAAKCVELRRWQAVHATSGKHLWTSDRLMNASEPEMIAAIIEGGAHDLPFSLELPRCASGDSLVASAASCFSDT